MVCCGCIWILLELCLGTMDLLLATDRDDSLEVRCAPVFSGCKTDGGIMGGWLVALSRGLLLELNECFLDGWFKVLRGSGFT